MDKQDCKKCAHYKQCDIPCIYVEYLINGKKHRIEPLISNIVGNRELSGRPYTDILAEGIDDIQSRIEYLTQIEDIRCRAIGAMIISNIPRKDICSLISMSPRQLIRVIKQNIHLSALKHIKMS